jgi:hypothetical protein
LPTFILQYNFLVVKYLLTLLTDFPCPVIQNVKEIKTSHGECQTFRARLACTGKKNAGMKFRLNYYNINTQYMDRILSVSKNKDSSMEIKKNYREPPNGRKYTDMFVHANGSEFFGASQQFPLGKDRF